METKDMQKMWDDILTERQVTYPKATIDTWYSSVCQFVQWMLEHARTEKDESDLRKLNTLLTTFDTTLAKKTAFQNAVSVSQNLAPYINDRDTQGLKESIESQFQGSTVGSFLKNYYTRIVNALTELSMEKQNECWQQLQQINTLSNKN